MKNIFFKLKSFIFCHSHLHGNDRSRAFTLVETLVAISVLMLSVTGPLYYASESLKAAIYARDQITAFYLAQDAFEQIRKIRDNNTYFSGNAVLWNSGLTGCENDSVTKCIIAKDLSSLYSLSSGIIEEETFLYRDASGIYSHDTGGTKTIFRRTVKIEPMDATDPLVDMWAGATEMKVTVFIKWNSRGTDREFTAYEFLRNFKD